jgi:hypothetical protein
LSWRKPAIFGFSFAVTDIALAWILGYLPKRRSAGWLLAGSLAVFNLMGMFVLRLLNVAAGPGTADRPQRVRAARGDEAFGTAFRALA